MNVMMEILSTGMDAALNAKLRRISDAMKMVAMIFQLVLLFTILV